MHIKLILLFILLISPNLTLAAVTINEIAWMGGSASANHEWIELYNTEGNSVSLEGWVIEDGANLSIDLSGNISPYEYAVLERSSDDTVSGPAFLIYTGALVNSGATLVLRNAEGLIVDQVSGGENWENIGGDNVTKETAQYTTSGWVTDVATPGKQNNDGQVIVEDTLDEENKDTTSKTNKSKSNKGSKTQTVKLVTPDTVLKLNTDIQTVAYVNQEIPLSVKGEGISERIIDSLKYDWNFGDTNVAFGRNVKHVYEYPGTYVVTVRAAYARHDQVARHEITILPVNFSVTRNDRGDVQIHNDSHYDVDASGYVIKGEKTVIFPPRTIILPKSTITIPKNRLGSKNNNMVAVYDTEKTLLASTFSSIAFASSPVVENTRTFSQIEPQKEFITTQSVKPTKSTSFGFIKDNDTEINVPLEEKEDAPVTNSVKTIDSENTKKDTPKPAQKDNRWPYVAFAGLLGIAFTGMYLGKSNV